MSTLQVSNIHLESTANNRIQYNGSNSYLIVAGGTTVATVNSSGLTVTGNSNFDSGVLFVDGTNNRVGVGTTSPSAKLDVVGDAEINGNATVTNDLFIDSASNARIWIDRGSDSDNAFLGFRSAGTAEWQFASASTAKNLIVYRYAGGVYQDAPISIFNSTGYVQVANRLGIGTSSPSAMLDVVGSSELNGDVVFGGAIDEKVYNLTGTALDPSNGTIQYKEITSNVTLTDSISEGESITVMIKSTTPNDTVTWPTTTWVNNGKTAPTTITGDWTVVALWKVSTTLYGALVGDGS